MSFVRATHGFISPICQTYWNSDPSTELIGRTGAKKDRVTCYTWTFCATDESTLTVRPCVTAKLPVLRPWFWILILLKYCTCFLLLYCLLGRGSLQASSYCKMWKCRFIQYLRAAYDLEPGMKNRLAIFPLSMQIPKNVIFKQWNPLPSRPKQA